MSRISVLTDSRSPIFRCAPLRIILLGHTLVHVTASHKTVALPPFYRGFEHHNVEMHKPLVHGIPDIPIPDFSM